MRSDDQPNEWWRIDPHSGARLDPSCAHFGDPVCYLGDGLLNEVAMVADNIDATFGSSRHFTDEEARQLLVDRIVPNSVRPYHDAASELLESVDDLWTLVDESYQQRWGRPANDVERRFTLNHAFSVMRRK